MKKITYILLVLVLCLSSLGCGNSGQTNENTEAETSKENTASTKVTLEKILSCGYVKPDSGISLVNWNMNPCVVTEGRAFVYQDNVWNEMDSENGIREVFSGENFCALDQQGKILTDADAFESYDGLPLTTAAIHYNAEQMVHILNDDKNDEKLSLLGGNIFTNSIVYLDNGCLKVFKNGEGKVLSDSIAVSKISGNFILTEDGDVIRITYNDFDGDITNINLKKVSTEKYIDISACDTAPRCIGIREDGTVNLLWSDVELNLNLDMGNVKAVSMGFNYAVILCDDGHVEFRSSDYDTEQEVMAQLNTFDEKAIDITCYSNNVAVLLENGDVVKLRFDWKTAGGK